MRYQYFINLDERGSFYADVRAPDSRTVYEIRAGDELGEDETSIFDDGYMRDAHDLDGLEEYLMDRKIIKPSDVLVWGN